MLAIKLVVLLLVAALAVRLSVKIGSRQTRGGDTVPTVKAQPIGIVVGVILLIFSLVLLGSIGQIGAGKRGVVLRFGAVTDRVLGEGIYVVTPFVNSVEIMEVRVQAFHAKATAVSKDLQEVTTEVTLNYALDPKKVGTIFQTLNRDYEVRIITPAIQESVKASTAKFTAEELVTLRENVKKAIELAIMNRLASHGLLMETVSITNFDFSPSFKKAVEDKVVAQQQVLTEKKNLEKMLMLKDQKIAMAQAEAESLRIQKMEVTPELIELRRIEVEKAAIDKWNGVMPTFVGGSGPVPIMNTFGKQ